MQSSLHEEIQGKDWRILLGLAITNPGVISAIHPMEDMSWNLSQS